MRLMADYHVHTKFSRFFHGKNTIEEMVNTANALGLTEIAITDHGFKHWCRTSKAKLMKAREIIDDINTWSTTKVLLGIEADIIAEDGTIDVDNETLAMLDILIVGYHKLIKTDFAGYFGTTSKSKEAVAKCTNAFLNAIARYPVTIVSHIDSILTTDLYKIGCACRDKGVMIEINNRHTKWNKKQVEDLIASDCLFAVSSDAHCREDVGRVDNAFDIIKKYGIPSESVVNVEFALDEKSDTDIEFDAYRSFYEEQIAKQREIEREKESKLQAKAEHALSQEMEDALKQIAEEKGIVQEDVDEDFDDSDEYYIKRGTTLEELALIREAQEYISQNRLKEFESQNEKLEDLPEDIKASDDVVMGVVETNVEEQPNAAEPVVVEKNIQTEEQENVVVVEKKIEEKQVEVNPQEQSSADKVLSVMMGAKQKETTSKTRNTTTKKDVVVNQTKREKKSVGGFMNDSLGIVDNAEKNETKKTTKNTAKKSTTEERK